VTRADPKDGGVASKQWQKAVFVDGDFRPPAANIEEFTERRWLTVNTAPAHYPLLNQQN
jgi:hypothetical protein